MGLMSMLGYERRSDIEARAQVVMDSGEAMISDVLNADSVSDAVTMKEAMGFPPIWSAINFLSGAMAGFPIEICQRTTRKGADKKVNSVSSRMLASSVNELMTSFDWREAKFSQVFGPGRGYTYIERDKAGMPINLFPMDYYRTTVRRDRRGRVFYDYRRENGTEVTYPASDVIDIAFLRKSDYISSHNPIHTCRSAIRQGLNADRYSRTVFGKNGIPPYVLKGAFGGAADAAKRAAKDVLKVIRRAAANDEPLIPVPKEVDISRLGDDPSKMQLTDVQRFAVEQVARIYNLPPMFLQDLMGGQYNNTEHQDLHLVKHTLRRWVKKFEQELTLKLFGRDSKFYVKLNIDAILRGDFKNRMEGIAKAVQNGILTPNEGRELEGREAKDGGDDLMIQGATVPITMAGKVTGKLPKEPTE